MKACIKVTYGDVSKKSCKLMFKFHVYFRNIEVINNFRLDIFHKLFGDMVSCTPQFKHKNDQKASFNFAERYWMLYVPM